MEREKGGFGSTIREEPHRVGEFPPPADDEEGGRVEVSRTGPTHDTTSECGYPRRRVEDVEDEIEGDVPRIPGTLDGRVEEVDWKNVARMALRGLASPIRTILEDLGRGEEVSSVAARSHAGLARATADLCRYLATEHEVASVVLSGGVFQNVVLLECTASRLAEHGLRPLVPGLVPPNDGGRSYGQAVIAAAR